MNASDLPALNAGLNATATVLLVAGFVFIRAGRKSAHRNCMVAAFVVSCAFLSTYVVHKVLVHGVHTPFGGAGFWKIFYYGMLGSHVVLAMVIVPMILATIARAARARHEEHRVWAKRTFPLWLYVSVTGVLVYFMLYRWFPRA